MTLVNDDQLPLIVRHLPNARTVNIRDKLTMTARHPPNTKAFGDKKTAHEATKF